MEEAYIGIDVGTQGLKAVVINPMGRVLMTTFSEYPTSSVNIAWTEQQPGDWERALSTALNVIARENLTLSWKAIGITGQMHTTVVCDADGNPLRPAILWSDQRAASYAGQLESRYGLEHLLDVTGNKPLTNFSALRLLWIRDQERHLYEQIRHVAVAKDWMRFRLTRQWGSEVSDASGTYLLNVKNRQWATDFMTSLDISPDWWGPVSESIHVAGTMQFGPPIFHGLPVVAGAGDQAASAIGTGLGVGELGISLGTSGVLFWPLDHYQLPPHPSIHAFCHAEQETWHWMSVTQSAALSLRWLRDQFYAGEPYALLDKDAADSPPGSDGLIFLPYLNGERAPIMQPHARGGFLGISSTHRRAHFARAVLEGVAYSLKHCYTTMNPQGTMTPRRLIMTGGGAKSSLWTQIVADVMGQEVWVVDDPGAAVGAAWLARLGVLNQVERMPLQNATVVRPGFQQDIYSTGFARYERLIDRLIPLWADSD